MSATTSITKRYQAMLPGDLLSSDLTKVDRLISMKVMGEITGWSRQTIIRAENDGHLPRRRKLPNGHTAFLASEVQSWIEALPVAPLAKVD